MKLDEEQKNKLLQSLAQKWPEPRLCPICRRQQWNILDKVFEIREYQTGGIVIGGPLVPVVAAICINCGNTLLFNAITLGIVQSERKEAKNE